MTQTNIDELKKIFSQKKEQALKDYYTFLKFQSVSSEPSFKDQVISCADWLASYLKDMGFQVELWPTSGHPVIYATYLKAGSEKPTLLIYNHYDVQPVDPVELWESPPFDPVVREGEVYARGAQDNKGQCFYVIQALKALIEKDHALPINVKLCIEGEEECGSAGLSSILSKKAKELKADYLAIVDLGLPKPDVPAITLGIRGLVTMDVEVEGSNRDLHSGSHGGIVYNPIHALVEILAKTRDPSSGRILVPGFYDGIEEITDEEKSKISFDLDAEDYQETFGTVPSGGEKKFSPLERNWLRPTLEINGICGGYCGAGFKTVIPAKAFAKISCRLVPKQDPNKIGQLVASFLEKNAPEGTRVKAHVHPGVGVAVHSKVSSKIVQAFAKAYQDVFKAPCEFIFEGASIPVTAELAKTSHAEVVLVGLGLATDRIHSPNEHFGLDRIEKGFLIIARTLQILGES